MIKREYEITYLENKILKNKLIQAKNLIVKDGVIMTFSIKENNYSFVEFIMPLDKILFVIEKGVVNE